MSEKISVDLGNVQKTLLLPLWGRAFESKKENLMLIDRTALAIIDQVDYDFASLANNLNELTQIAWIMRSVCVDEVVSVFLKKYPRATIVNIGCELDTTFDRVDNGMLTWYDLDMLDVIRLRKKLIQETERRKFIPASFLEPDWMSELKVDQNVLFIAAGVFYYFEEHDVKEFLIRLAHRYPGSELIFDVSSPYGVKVANRMVINRSGLDERSFLKWGLESPKIFSDWDTRIRVLNTYYYFGRRAKSLNLKNRLVGILSDVLKIQYMVKLKMGDIE
jgi:O-methyltransferase involved in polyketide biosynthesis